MHFCANCGNKVDDSAAVCPVCGATQGNGQQYQAPNQQQYQQYQAPNQQQYQQYQAPNQQQYQQYQAPMNMGPISDWDGTVLDTVVNSIIGSLIMTFTCGIGTPWAVCYIMKFIIGHATIDGKRLRFDGNGGDLFAQWIKWWLLCLITCGIYGFWVYPRMYRWICNHIHHE